MSKKTHRRLFPTVFRLRAGVSVDDARRSLLEDHHDLTTQLVATHFRLENLLPQERAAKNGAFLHAEGSDRVRGEIAQQASLHLTVEIIAAQRRVDALTAEIEDVRLQLHYS